MTYCTPDNLREDNELLRDNDVFPDSLLNPYILKCQARIDSKLSERYQVPLTDPVPEIIKTIEVEMACGYVLIGETASRTSQEMINLGNGKIKRSDADLDDIVEKGLLDKLPGIVLATVPGRNTSPAMATTTPGKSPLEEALNW